MLGLATVTGVGFAWRHPIRSIGGFVRALPEILVVLARRLNELPDAVTEMAVLTWLEVRFSRTRDVWLPLGRIEHRMMGLVRRAVRASDRFVLRTDQIVDTYRVWGDWRGLRHLDPLPHGLSTFQRYWALVALGAGLSRREVARLSGVSRRTVRAWIAEDRSSDEPVLDVRFGSRATGAFAGLGAWGRRWAARPVGVRVLAVVGLAIGLLAVTALPAAAVPSAGLAAMGSTLVVPAVAVVGAAALVAWGVPRWKRWIVRAGNRDGVPIKRFRPSLTAMFLLGALSVGLLFVDAVPLAVRIAALLGWVVAALGLNALEDLTAAQRRAFRLTVAPVVAVAAALVAVAFAYLGDVRAGVAVASVTAYVTATMSWERMNRGGPRESEHGSDGAGRRRGAGLRSALARIGRADVAELPGGPEAPGPPGDADPGDAMPSDGPEHEVRSKRIGSRHVVHLDEDSDAAGRVRVCWRSGGCWQSAS
ncbi:hypothetical protein BJF90_09230 [Pseudonocardia sp. CNS-004]|nr:hypothetical protein BJF90_09230 [Pseudonocardia sp. CNS-004]